MTFSCQIDETVACPGERVASLQESRAGDEKSHAGPPKIVNRAIQRVGLANMAGASGEGAPVFGYLKGKGTKFA